MNNVNHLLLAHQQAKSAAAHHQSMAHQIDAVAGLLDAMRKASNQPHPIVELAQALLPMGPVHLAQGRGEKRLDRGGNSRRHGRPVTRIAARTGAVFECCPHRAMKEHHEQTTHTGAAASAR